MRSQSPPRRETGVGPSAGALLFVFAAAMGCPSPSPEGSPDEPTASEGPSSRPGSGPSSRPATRPGSRPGSSASVPAPGPHTYFAGPSWTAEGLAGRVRAQLEPESGEPAIGRMQRWILTVTDAAGAPVVPAQIGLNGGMPAHGHGLPTRPQVTAHLGGGRYRVEGLAFNMPGDWTLIAEVRTRAWMDRVQFAMRLEVAARGWTDPEKALLASLRWSAAPEPPPPPSNPVADDPRAAALGRKLFFDVRLSGSGESSCASCHQPERSFTDGRPRGRGEGEALRNTPTLLGVAHGTWFYWDGRRDSLWSQALVPFEAADEMGGSRVQVVSTVASDPLLAEAYAEIFGPMPRIDFAKLPRRAGPFGDASTRDAWQRMDAGEQVEINRVYANLGRAIAAFERTLRVPPSRFDAYVDALLGGGPADQLTEAEQRGLQIFLDDDSRCLRCHNGPMLTNGGFHNIGTANRSGGRLDYGRVFGVQAVLMDEFNCLGPYSGAPPDACGPLRFLDRSDLGHLEGAFKVPTLRQVANTGPYFHDGRHATLEDVVRYYNEPDLSFDGVEIAPLGLTEPEIADLVAFLKTL